MSATHPPAGYYPDPDTGLQRWWDGQTWGPAAEPAVAPRPRKSKFWPVTLTLFALGGIWTTGAFDQPLSSVGLNFHDCVRNGFGATFCGDAAKTYQRRITNFERSLNTP